MKLLLLGTSLVLIFLACWSLSSISPSYGLSQNEITLSLQWSHGVYYQGDSGTAIVSLESTCGDELEFTWLGIHYAWMQTDHYYSLDLAGNSVRVPSGGSTTFSAISFEVPSNAPIGSNEYYVSIHFNEHHWYGWSNGWTWTSSTSQIYIYDAYEKAYNELRPQVSSKLDDAQNANYKSPDAKSLLSQAQNEYSLADSLANQGKWQDAVSHLNTASSLLTQAPAKEQTYEGEQNTQQLIFIIAGVLAIVITMGIVVIVRKRKSPSKINK